MKHRFRDTMEYIVSVLRDAGYEPYEQLYAYASTGNDAFITRKGDARTLISTVDRLQLMKYIFKHCK